ncbi:hypothetical protein O6H91_09G071900 [Diphasiastrum complanatum]|uniref:Uncharacterized protein n=3 Tax=Diphasiastrum complanatum TaxID=34168 RepID=A0ACC2CQD2_DIPCM|nr:hypothetical protein O6H91_Y302100 [Diphasiastrum complanatum]KAJ7544273.1 hypothetical protein O6H91_09G071900 [Diphasiastrum complanatum]
MHNIAGAQVCLMLQIVGIILCSLRLRGVVEATDSTPMFVFGDSYLDTGNRDNLSRPWNPPYGMTWPDRPAGRYSDGHLLTDFVAKVIGSSSPIPYRVCKEEIYRSEIVKYGVNFAVGASGVFQGIVNSTNLGAQVDHLISLLEAHSIELPPPQKTLMLLNIGGNDYSQFFKENGSKKDLPDLIRRIVGGITENLKRLHALGVRRFAVFNLAPMGCNPKQTTPISYKYCISAVNIVSEDHNRVLLQEVHATLSALKDTDFSILDQYRAFLLVINHAHLFGFKHRLKPCCQIKTGRITECGLRDENGEPLYEVCSDPENYFFWDGDHPTQAGWSALVAIIAENQFFNQRKPIKSQLPVDDLALNRHPQNISIIDT